MSYGLSGATMYRSYGPSSPSDLAGTESLTAAQELMRYRNYLIAYRSALSAAQTQVQKDYAETLLAQANQYKAMYLSRGDGDLTAMDRTILAVSDAIAGLGTALDKTIDWAGDKAGSTLGKVAMPLVPILLAGAAVLYFWSKRGR
jgi:hypothetical protein